MQCVKCKKKILSDSRFCKFCGVKIEEKVINKPKISSNHILVFAIAATALLMASGIFYYYGIFLPQKVVKKIELEKIATNKALEIEEARILEAIKKQEMDDRVALEKQQSEEQAAIEKRQAEENANKERALIIKQNTTARNSCLQTIKDKYNKKLDDVEDDYSIGNTSGLSINGIKDAVSQTFANRERAEQSVISAYERAKSDCYAKYPVSK